MGLQELNGRQKSPPLKAIFIKMHWLNIGCRHQRNPARKQSTHHFPENHGVTNIRHKKLIEAQYIGFICDFLGYLKQWILSTRPFLQTTVHTTHETMEVHTQTTFTGQTIDEQVHQHGFAAPNSAPDVKATLGNWGFKLLSDSREQTTCLRALGETRIEFLQQRYDLRLGWVFLKLPTLEFRVISLYR